MINLGKMKMKVLKYLMMGKSFCISINKTIIDREVSRKYHLWKDNIANGSVNERKF